MEMAKTHTHELKSKRKNYKIWLLLTFVSIYPLYYYFTHIPEEVSFESLIFEKFESRGLLLILFLFPFTMFWINFLQKDKRIMKDFQYYLEIKDNVLLQHTFSKTYSVQKGKSEPKILFEDSNSHPLCLKVDQIKEIGQRRKKGKRTTESISMTISGTNTTGDRLGQPLELTKSTSNYDYQETYFKFENGQIQPYHSAYTVDEVKKFLKI